jgi:hypothetical protein
MLQGESASKPPRFVWLSKNRQASARPDARDRLAAKQWAGRLIPSLVR